VKIMGFGSEEEIEIWKKALKDEEGSIEEKARRKNRERCETF
jgi:hypothetical protein